MVYNMITLHLQGGLGNQMFQLFSALAYSIEHNEKLIISTHKYDEKERPTYWNSLFKKLKDNVDPTVPNCPRLCEEAFHYTPLPKKSGVTFHKNHKSSLFIWIFSILSIL